MKTVWITPDERWPDYTHWECDDHEGEGKLVTIEDETLYRWDRVEAEYQAVQAEKEKLMEEQK